MPPPRKVDRLPPEFKRWLQDELKARSFSDYVALTDALNARCEAEGVDLQFGKSAIHAYGQEYKMFAELQEQCQDEIRAFMEEASLQDETDVTKSLFQQLTAIQWRLQMAMASPDKMPDPRGLKDLTTALNNLIRSTSLREKIMETERARIIQSERDAMAQKLDDAVQAGDVEQDAAQRAREIMGFA